MSDNRQPYLYYTRRPAPPLDRFVLRLWYWEGPAPAHARDHILPDGSSSLIVNLAEDQVLDFEGPLYTPRRYPGAVLVGAFSRYAVIDTRQQSAILGVSFHPGGAWPFFETAADELQNQHVGMGDLWGPWGRTLRERILAVPTPEARLALVEAELLVRATRPFERRAEIDFALLRLTRGPQDQSIAMLSEYVGLGARRFTRLFELQVGMTPKVFARIKRFEHMLRRSREPGIDWSQVAADCGYFDQSHLIRECRTLSGFTPAELVRRRAGDSHHVAV